MCADVECDCDPDIGVASVEGIVDAAKVDTASVADAGRVAYTDGWWVADLHNVARDGFDDDIEGHAGSGCMMEEVLEQVED